MERGQRRGAFSRRQNSTDDGVLNSVTAVFLMTACEGLLDYGTSLQLPNPDARSGARHAGNMTQRRIEGVSGVEDRHRRAWLSGLASKTSVALVLSIASSSGVRSRE